MSFSEFLTARRSSVKALVAELSKKFSYVSVLGADVRAVSVHADENTSGIEFDWDTECGFVIKLHNGGIFFEYSLDDISGDIPALAEKIAGAFPQKAFSSERRFSLEDEALVQSFDRPGDLDNYTQGQLLEYCKDLQKKLSAKSEKILNAAVTLSTFEVSKLFISRNRELDQHYTWVNGELSVIYEDNDKTVEAREDAFDCCTAEVMAELPTRMDKLLHTAHILTLAKPIVPGVYDVITDPSITGLIAHEAFGHGVELDQFVKDRALAKEHMGKYVASPIVNMRDGAASTLSAASYFFDDDGVLAGDTQIIKDGVLVAGISDLASAVQLGLAPTGNGRRESTRRKSYARMSNTFFERGTDKLEDMIASIDHGYLLIQTNNGMEDPKNWGIQCVAEYGIEIKDGKLTENYVSPVVISGYVPELLQSISMISDDFKVSGEGTCGKGHKEGVRVSDGGPALKARAKLG